MFAVCAFAQGPHHSPGGHGPAPKGNPPRQEHREPPRPSDGIQLAADIVNLTKAILGPAPRHPYSPPPRRNYSSTIGRQTIIILQPNQKYVIKDGVPGIETTTVSGNTITITFQPL